MTRGPDRPRMLSTGAVREAREVLEQLTMMGLSMVLGPSDSNHLVRMVRDAVGRGASTDPPVIFMLEQRSSKSPPTHLAHHRWPRADADTSV